MIDFSSVSVDNNSSVCVGVLVRWKAECGGVYWMDEVDNDLRDNLY